MPNYQNGKIYKVVDLNEEMIYIGSTTQSLCNRMMGHRTTYKHKRHQNIRSFLIFDKYGIENCKILLIENCPCNTKEELHKREGEIIKSIECVNKQTPGRTKEEYTKEYNEKNKDYMNERHRLYVECNKEKINKQRRDNYQNKKSIQ